ncbi:uncharacterized protein EI97DRAFT_400663 [Westerdykella ornata]|uniref:Pre-rRNA-processing protein RIX1 n=1 Tax=Westerdykella ornata TaxID=318751 RepID=A0A6A6JHS0_WESOR|nr:uncharacterized protein EI97DRAFT_400663 [Westerdykella ornata]KAF2275186.1 hypothetical protein EI97DRAFT_400663 [Westerdykella ornata]
MAKPGPNAAELSTLRAISFRLSSTSSTQLPQQVPAITASLANCKSLLSSTQASGSQSASEASVAVHKYRTLLSTLLQDRTVQGRWTAIVLVKASLEVGGWETLQKSLPWVRGLLGVLSKPDPPSSKRLCLITLTRIFILTRDYPTLVREIATPSLPAYIQACLQLISSGPPASLLETILESFNQLLPRHPTIFRTYIKQLQQLLGQLMAPTPSSKISREQLRGQRLATSSEISESARRLYVQLACCAPKGASSEEWAKSLKDTITNTHRIADKVFRAVVEEWQPIHTAPAPVNGHTLEDEVQDLEQDVLHLPPWSGIHAGGERLIGLLHLVREYLRTPTAGAINLQMSFIVDLLTRMLSLAVPAASGPASLPNAVRFNNQVSKEEREILWSILPQVHVAALEVLIVLTCRFEKSAVGLELIVLDQLTWIFGSEKGDVHIRAVCYRALAQLLHRCGAALPKSSIDTLSPLIRRCCEDVLPMESTSSGAPHTPSPGNENGSRKPAMSTNADAFLKSPLSQRGLAAGYAGLQQSAMQLLPVLLSKIRAHNLSDSLRMRMDRTAILTQHKDAMIASVLNPPPSKKFGKPAASILPLLARSFSGEADVEIVLRPRMPVLRTGRSESDDSSDMEAEAEEVEEEAGEEAEEQVASEELDVTLDPVAETRNHISTTLQAEHTPQVHLPEPELPPPAPAFETTQSVEGKPDSSPSISVGKRPQTGDIPQLPAKRVKMDEPEQPYQVVPPATTLQKVTVSSVSVPSCAPAAQEIHADDSEGDDDDFGELVLGQDTDEEADV